MDKINQLQLFRLKKKDAKIIIGITLFLVVIGIVILLASRSSGEEKTSTTNTAVSEFPQLNILEGAPRIGISSEIRKTIEEGQDLKVNTSLTTDSISRALIFFSDNSFIIVDADSEIVYKGIANEEIMIEVKKGSIFARSEGKNSISVTSQSAIINGKTSRFSVSNLVDKTEISVDKTKVKVSIKNGENTSAEVEVIEGGFLEIDNSKLSEYTNDELNKNIKFNVSDSENQFKILVDCLDNKASDLFTGGNVTKENFLKTKSSDMKSCTETVKTDGYDKDAQKNKEEAELKAKQEESTTGKNAPRISNVTDQGTFTTEDKIVCTWSAAGEGIVGYEYSIGSSAGQTDKKDWTKTLETSVTELNLGMVYSKTYYCNVRASNKTNTSEPKSSDGIMFDNSTATIATDSPFDLPPGDVSYSGSIELTNADKADIEVSSYLKDQDGKYFKEGSWIATVYMYQVSVSGTAPSLTWTIDYSIPPASTTYTSGFSLYLEVKNKKTGRILEQSTFLLE